MGRAVLLVAFLLAGCASETPREADGVQRGREQARERARLEAENRRLAAELAQRDQRAREARLEAEWPEPVPVIVIKGEPAPVKTATPVPSGNTPASREAAERYDAQAAQQAREDRRRAEGARDDADCDEEKDAREFERRLVNGDKDAVQADPHLRGNAKRSLADWVRAAAERRLPVPTQEESQRAFDKFLRQARANWIHNDRVRRTVKDRVDKVR